MKKTIFHIMILIIISSVSNGNSCYQLREDSAIQACLGNAYSTSNEDARNIILGHCYSLSNRANDNGLRDVCLQGKRGCYSLRDSDAVYSCRTCDGSNKWARVYATGYSMTCYKSRKSTQRSSSSSSSSHNSSSSTTSSQSTNINRRGVVKGLDPSGDGFLSLRKYPKGKEIGRLYNGDRVKVIKRDGIWYKVKDIRSGKIGWSHSKWIRLSKRSSNGKDGVVKGLDPYGDGFLSIRKRPKGKQIGKLYNGARVRILSKRGKWLKIQDKSSGLIGWSHGDWIVGR